MLSVSHVFVPFAILPHIPFACDIVLARSFYGADRPALLAGPAFLMLYRSGAPGCDPDHSFVSDSL